MKFLKCGVFALLLSISGISGAYAQAEHPAPSPSDTVRFKVKGITCSMDLRQISDKVEAVAGVHRCEVLKEGAVSRFQVAFDPKTATTEEIHAAVEGTGGCQNPNEFPYKVKALKR